ncbi:MAG: pre-peptidase C-terminal domain-containing protein [Magnetococcales bacterium]|nr:pre-peptidase C-terminal domain-containing protein [Magnetococcales bacterium]
MLTTLTSHYTFNGQIIDLINNDPVTVYGTSGDPSNATSTFGSDATGPYWSWTSTNARGGGFTIEADLADKGSYTLAMRFRFGDMSGYRKIIDYRNRTTDDGLYILNGFVNFYPLNTGSVAYAANDLIDLIATRDASSDLLTIYLSDGHGGYVKALEIHDTTGISEPSLTSNGLARFGFFYDDLRTGGEATQSGKVYQISLWDGSLTAGTITGPAVTSLELDADDDSGPSNNDRITLQTEELTIRGFYATVGTSLLLFDDSNDNGLPDSSERLATVPITATSWGQDITLAPGIHAVRTVPVDSNGLIAGPVSAALSVMVVESDDGASDLGISGRLLPGHSVTGVIESAGDSDWFAIDLAEGVAYAFELEGVGTSQGTLVDPYLQVMDQDGTATTYNADVSPTNNNARVVYIPASSGTYYLAASGWGNSRGDNTGSYRLSATSIVPTDDHPEGTETTESVSIGGSVTGNIDFTTDQDWFIVDLIAGTNYRFDLEGSSTGQSSLSDPYLALWGGDGSELTYSTDINDLDKNASIFYTPSSSGTYYLSAWGLDASFGIYNTGRYRLSAAIVPVDDIASDSTTTATLSLGEGKTASIDFSGDRDWWAITLTAGVSYRFSLEGGQASQQSALPDPYLQLLNSGSTVVAYNANVSPANNNAAIIYTPVTTETYYVEASGWHSAVGGYRVTVSETTPPGDDYAAHVTTTGQLSVHTPVTSSLDFPGDQDWFAISLVAGTTYLFDLTGTILSQDQATLSDPYLELIDRNGDLVAFNKDMNGSNNSARILYTADSSDIFYLNAASYDGSHSGSYLLSAREIVTEDDYTSNTSVTSWLLIDKPVSDSLGTPEERRWYAITLHAGIRYTFDLKRDDSFENGLTDPYLQLLNGSGQQVAYNYDISSNNTDARIVYTATHDGIYYLVPWGYGVSTGYGTGDYRLSAAAEEGDTTAPPIPIHLQLAAIDDTGRSNSDHITRQTSALTISGSGGEIGARLVVMDDNLPLTTVAVTATDWSSTIALTTGSHVIRALQIDAAGNSSTPSLPLLLTIDNAPPLAPSALDLDRDDDTGVNSSDNITSRTNGLTIRGSDAEAGATLILFDGTTPLTTLAIATSSWSTDVSLKAGTHTIRASQQDAAGNDSVLSAPLTITVVDNSSAPAAPTSLDLAAANDSGRSSSDNITRQSSALVISGKSGKPGATLVLFDDRNGDGLIDGGEALTTTGVTAADWKGTISLTSGSHELRAIQTDVAGFSSGASLPLSITIDTLANQPEALDLDNRNDSGLSDTDGITNQTSGLMISGYGGETGASLVLFNDKNSNGSADSGEGLTTLAVTGAAWSSSVNLAAGSYAIRAAQTDLAGNISSASPSLPIIVDTSKPVAPTALDLDSNDDTGAPSDNLTSQINNLTISGKGGEVGGQIVLLDGEIALTTADVSAVNWSSDISLSPGTHAIRALQRDRAGNSSVLSTPLLVTIDNSSSLPAPTDLDLDSTDDSGRFNSDNVTRRTSNLTISGRGGKVTGATLQLFDDRNGNQRIDSGELLTTLYTTASDWMADINLTIGSHSIKALQIDADDNGSVASQPLAVTVNPLSSLQLSLNDGPLFLPDEWVVGSDGDDTLTSLGGNDAIAVSDVETLIGRSGIEAMTIIRGHGTVAVANIESLINENGADTVTLLSGSRVAVSRVQSVVGSDDTDTIRMLAAAALSLTAVESITGSSGNDTVTIGSSSDLFSSRVETILGTGGDDTLTLMAKGNVAISQIDSVIGSAAMDTLTLLTATSLVTSQVNTVIGSSGADTVTMLDSTALLVVSVDTLIGSSGTDRVGYLGQGAMAVARIETITGSSGNETISLLASGKCAVADVDTLIGTTGNDTISLLSAGSIAVASVEVVIGSRNGIDRVEMISSGALSVSQVETVIGSSGDDVITLKGKTGVLVTGGAGHDTITGSSGKDRFRFTGPGTDTLYNFERSQDKLLFDGLKTGGDFVYLAGAVLTATGRSQARFDKETKQLQVDSRGSGTPDLVINLPGVLSLSQDNFIWTAPTGRTAHNGWMAGT